MSLRPLFRSRGQTRRSAPTVFAIFLAAACGADSPEQEARRPVILISIDSLRADHCTPYGYRPQFAAEDTTPFLARLAAEGVLWENGSSPSSWTLPSHLSIVTGMSVREHGVLTRKFKLPDATENLAGKFQRAGYATAGFYSAPFLHPAWGYGPGFDTYRGAAPYLNSLETEQAITTPHSAGMQDVHDQADADNECSERVIDAALAWLEEQQRYRRPFFLFLHLWDPHYDYEPPAEYAERFHPGYDGALSGAGFYKDERSYTREELDHILALYDAEIRYTDDQIARLFAALEQWGVAEDVILGVTSDHGDEFFEHGQKGHHKTLYQEVVHVPLLVRAKGLAPQGLRLRGSVCNYDLAPTLLDLAGLTPWPDRAGQSLRPAWQSGGDQDREALMHLTHPGRGAFLDAWRTGSDKLLLRFQPLPQQLTRFDLAADPGELRGETLASPGQAAAGPRAWTAFQADRARARGAATMEESPAMKSELAELGYAGEDQEPEEPRPDPGAATPR